MDWFLYLFFFLIWIYSTYALHYSCEILESPHENKGLRVCLSLLLALLLGSCLILDISILLTYPLIFLCFVLVFRLLSRANLQQIFFGSAVFAFHIIVMHILVTAISSRIHTLPPATLSTELDLRLQVSFYTVILIFAALLTLNKFVPAQYVKRVSLGQPYSMLVSGFSVIAILTFTLFSIFILNHHYYTEQLSLTIASTLLNLVLFYFTFLYCIELIQMMSYKEQTEEIEQKYSALLLEKRKIIEQFTHDGLTGLLNRKAAYEALHKLYEDETQDFSVLFVDINQLKYVNDEFGHICGDKLIRGVAASISRIVSESALVARLGGDEMLILLTDCSHDDLPLLAERLMEAVREDGAGEDFPVSASIGGVYVDTSLRGQTLQSILDEADRLMRLAKQGFYASGGVKS